MSSIKHAGDFQQAAGGGSPEFDMEALRKKRNDANVFAKKMGLMITEMHEGHAETHLPVTDDLLNPIGSIHGGCMYTVADVSGGAAAHSFGSMVTTLEGSLHFLRPGLNCTELIGTGDVVKRGKKVLVVDVSVLNQDHVELAHGIFSYMAIPDYSNFMDPIRKHKDSQGETDSAETDSQREKEKTSGQTEEKTV